MIHRVRFWLRRSTHTSLDHLDQPIGWNDPRRAGVGRPLLFSDCRHPDAAHLVAHTPLQHTLLHTLHCCTHYIAAVHLLHTLHLLYTPRSPVKRWGLLWPSAEFLLAPATSRTPCLMSWTTPASWLFIGRACGRACGWRWEGRREF